MPLTNSDIRFKIDFNLDDTVKNAVVTDLIQNAYNTTYGHTTANVRIIIRVVSPSGTLYENTGWGANNFASPDMNGNTSDWVSGAISLPTLGSNIVTGNYSVEYKVSVDSGVSVQAELTGTNKKTYNYNVSLPTNVFDYEISCISSQIEFDDNNTYPVTDYTGAVKTPTTISRSWLIIYPSTVLPNISETTDNFTIGYGTSYNSGSEIYRGEYKASLTSTLEYRMQQWSVLDTTNWVFVFIGVTHNEIFSVSCPDCSCNYYTCLVSLENSKQSYIEAGNQIEVARIEKSIIKLNWYWELYNLAVRCGKDYSEWCEKIRYYATATSECCDEDVTTPTKVTAWVTAIGGSGGSGTTWYFRTGADGHIGIPVVGDAEFFTTTAGFFLSGDIYYYKATGWAYAGNMTGSAGSSSDPMVYNDITDSLDAASGLLQTLKSYNLVGDTLATNGDMVTIEAFFDIIAGKTVDLSINIGLQNLALYTISTMVRSYIKVIVELNRKTSGTTMSEAKYTIIGLPDANFTHPIVSGVVDLTLNNTIGVNIQKSGAGGIGDVTCKYLRIIKYVS